MEQINEYQYEINGILYDSRDSWEYEKYIKPNLDKLKTKEEEVKEKSENIKIKYDEVDTEYYKQNGEPIKLPINSEKEYIGNKKFNVLNLGILTYFSNYQDLHEVEGFNTYDDDRYIYEDKIIKNKEKIEQYSKTKINTFIKNAKKLSKITNGRIIIVDEVKGQTVYRLQKGQKYVLIEKRMLESLISCTNNEMIKTYIFLKWRVGEEGGIVTRKEIAENIGYSINSCEMLQKVSDIVLGLSKLGFIRKENIVLKSVEQNEYNKRCYYEVIPYSQWIKSWNNGKIII